MQLVQYSSVVTFMIDAASGELPSRVARNMLSRSKSALKVHASCQSSCEMVLYYSGWFVCTSHLRLGHRNSSEKIKGGRRHDHSTFHVVMPDFVKSH